MSVWEEKHLGDLAFVNPSVISTKDKDKNIKYIDIASVNQGILQGYSNYNIADAPSRARRVVREGDTLFSTVRPNLRAYYYVRKCPENTIASTGFVVLRAKKKESERFIYYLVIEDNFVDWLSLVAKGSAYPAVDSNDFKKAKVIVPDIPTQIRIAEILSAYDDAIENNNRRIVLLEQAAQQLYCEWFIHFRFPGYEKTKFVKGLPEGWEVKRLGSMVDFNPQTRSPEPISISVPMAALSTSSCSIDTNYISIVDSASGSRFRNGDVLFARITPCLENGKTGYVDFLSNNEVACGSTEFIVMRSKSLSKYMVYFIARDAAFRQYAINSMNGADGRQRAREDALKRFIYNRPEHSVVSRFHNLAAVIFDEIRILNQKSQNLARQRDLLLPRLMSGKLEV